jgi:hypothetical protein
LKQHTLGLAGIRHMALFCVPDGANNVNGGCIRNGESVCDC